MYICEVFVTNANLNVNQLYSYQSAFYVEPFKRVEIKFAKAKNKAIVIKCYEIENIEEFSKTKGFKLESIISVIDEKPIINNEQYELAKWLSKITISPFISCLNTMLPKALRTCTYEFKPVFNKVVKLNEVKVTLTAKQKAIYEQLNDGMLLKDARKLSSSIIKTFVDKKIIEIISVEKQYHGKDLSINNNFKELTAKQKQAYDTFLASDKLVSLLFGVTGSGKTEVYLHLAREYLKKGQEVLILVPEISLTPQMISRVQERFNEVIFYHSELSDQERYEQYKRVMQGEIKIVVGTRSSVFLPFHNLGLIIIDEEHDGSYKQDSMPCYDAKTVAIKRALSFHAKVLLASATPSLVAYSHALKGDYGLLKLDERINKCLPQIEIVDLTTSLKKKESLIISNPLKMAIEQTLKQKKQVIILLNRRGYAPIVKCGGCGTTLMCEDCDVPLNFHKDENLLICHQCGRTYKATKYCPKCHQQALVYLGYGTKRIEEELTKLFPDASIARIDRDSTQKKGAHQQILSRFETGEINILIGTQMIAKGLDYPSVTLVGILNADAGLAHQDYNAAKLTFDLLMQAAGRSGRAKEAGKVIIQAFNPDHYVLKAVLSQDYNYFYKIEMNYRSKTFYPPYSHIMTLIVSDTSKERIANSLTFLEQRINELAIKSYKPVQLKRIMKNERYRILLCDRDVNKMINSVWTIIDAYLKEKHFARIKVDVDPLYLE